MFKTYLKSITRIAMIVIIAICSNYLQADPSDCAQIQDNNPFRICITNTFQDSMLVFVSNWYITGETDSIKTIKKIPAPNSIINYIFYRPFQRMLLPIKAIDDVRNYVDIATVTPPVLINIPPNDSLIFIITPPDSLISRLDQIGEYFTYWEVFYAMSNEFKPSPEWDYVRKNCIISDQKVFYQQVPPIGSFRLTIPGYNTQGERLGLNFAHIWKKLQKKKTGGMIVRMINGLPDYKRFNGE